MDGKTERRVLLAALVAACAVAACEYQVTEYNTPQPKMTRAPYLDRVIVYRHWVRDVDEIVRGGHCKRTHATHVGCADLEQIGPDDWKCDFYIQQPKDFNDVARLAVGGHEVVMHCFGATHE
jgi:hypothetical protein